MTEWLLGLWEKNKILFFILIIPVIIALALKIYQEIVFQQAKKSLDKTSKKSNEIKNKVAKQEQQAEDHLNKAKQAEDRINKREKDDKLDLDWHKDEE